MKFKNVAVLIIALAVAALSASTAQAVGTPAGTVISNSATLTYKDLNNNAKASVTTSVETTVAVRRGIDVTPGVPYNTASTEVKVNDYSFTIRNTGNATDEISIALLGTNQDGWTNTVYFDSNLNGKIDAGEPEVTSTGPLPQNSDYKVIVRAAAPAIADYNASNTITLTAVSQDGASAAKDEGVINIGISSAVVTITKVSSTYTPLPLSEFTYTITLANTDLQSTAYKVVVEDELDSDLILVSSFAPMGDRTYNPTTRKYTWSLNYLGPNTSTNLTLTVKVVEEVAEGSLIDNTAKVTFEDFGGNSFAKSASSIQGTVQELPGVDLSTNYAIPSSFDPGDRINIPFSVNNTGNGTDSFDLSYTDGSWILTNGTSIPVSWAFFVWNDINGDGNADSGEIGGMPITNTGNMAKDAILRFVAVATVPTNARYDAKSTVSVTAVSTSDTTPPFTADSFVATNDVLAPVLTLGKIVDKANAQPGEELTYKLTVTNVGDGPARTIVLVDNIPANTTYTAGSITVGGVAQSDGTSSDQADFNITNPGAVTVSIDNLDPGSSLVITFKVKVN